MKNRILLLTAVLFFAVACQDTLKNENPLSEDQKELIIDEALQSTMINELLSDIDIYSDFGEGWLKSASVLGEGCPLEITVEKPDEKPYWPRTVTIDFGDGCTNIWGKTKSGKIIIEKSAPWKDPGATRRITFEEYTVDGVLFEGVKEMVNKTKEGGDPTFEIGANLTLSFVKEKKNEEGVMEKFEVVVKRTVNKIQVWIEGFRDKDWRNNKFSLSGESSIEKKVGNEKKKIEKEYDAIIIQRGCRFPQGGTTSFAVQTFDNIKLEFTLDYNKEGDASEKCGSGCDCLARLITDDGEEVIDLSARWWKQVKDKSTKN